jgi:VRR-NUC domain.
MRAVRGAEGDWPRLRWLFAVPNGGWRAKRTAAAMKAEGAQAGVPDYLLPVGRGGYAGLAIELKTATGRVRPEQRAWLAHLESQGWQTAVARGWEQAWDVVRDYMALEPRQTAQEAIAGASGVSTPQADERGSQGRTERNRGGAR